MDPFVQLKLLAETEDSYVTNNAKTILRYKSELEAGKITQEEFAALLNSIATSYKISQQSAQLESVIALNTALNILLKIYSVV